MPNQRQKQNNPAAILNNVQPAQNMLNEVNLHIDLPNGQVPNKVDVKVDYTYQVNIFSSIKNKDFENIELYAKHGGDVNVKGRDGYTPLMLAIQERWQPADIKKFLDNFDGIDLSLFGLQKHSMSPLHGHPLDMALKYKDYETAKLIVNYAGKIHIGEELNVGLLGIYKEDKSTFYELLHHLEINELKDLGGIGILRSMTSTDAVDAFSYILKKIGEIPADSQHPLLGYAAEYGKSVEYVDILIKGGYVGEYAISATMYNLAIRNNEDKFKHILELVDNTTPILDFLTKHQDKITYFEKYAELCGAIIYENEPGTIFIHDVIDIHQNIDVIQNGPAPGQHVVVQDTAPTVDTIQVVHIPHIIEEHVI